MEHVYSIVVKVGDGSAQFDVDGMLMNLSDTAQEELVVLFWSKYSPWTSANVKSKNRRLNQILVTITRNLAQSTQNTTIALPTAILPLATLGVMVSGSRA